jgi:hypothetical protein
MRWIKQADWKFGEETDNIKITVTYNDGTVETLEGQEESERIQEQVMNQQLGFTKE